jgi:hypothetical protein
MHARLQQQRLVGEAVAEGGGDGVAAGCGGLGWDGDRFGHGGCGK